MQLLFRLVFLRFGAWIKVFGRRQVPRSGGLLVISNHQSSADPPVVQIACSRVIHFLARRELLDIKHIRKFIMWWRIIPISQSSADRGAIKTAVALLKAGRCVGIFPEGQLAADGKLQKILPGVAMILRLSKCPCVCVGLTDTRFVMPDETMVPRWSGRPITANWGHAHQFDTNATTDEIVAWVKGQLESLTGQNETLNTSVVENK